LGERNGKASGLRLKDDRDRLALEVAVAGPVAVIGIFVSTALERKTHRNCKKRQNHKNQKPLHETSPPGVAAPGG
jgi:hypothetical protein